MRSTKACPGICGEFRSGLYYLRARYYDPITAQFMSRDPMVAVTRSRHAYVGGNPLNATDPSGLLSCDWCGNVANTVVKAILNGISTDAEAPTSEADATNRQKQAQCEGIGGWDGPLQTAGGIAGMFDGETEGVEGVSLLDRLGFLKGKVNGSGTLESGATISRFDAVSNAA